MAGLPPVSEREINPEPSPRLLHEVDPVSFNELTGGKLFRKTDEPLKGEPFKSVYSGLKYTLTIYWGIIPSYMQRCPPWIQVSDGQSIKAIYGPFGIVSEPDSVRIVGHDVDKDWCVYGFILSNGCNEEFTIPLMQADPSLVNALDFAEYSRKNRTER